MAYKIKSKKVKEQKAYPFVNAFNERGDVNKVKNTSLWQLHNKAINNPKSLTRAEKDSIYSQLRNSSYGGGTGVALLGVMFNFRPVLKKYYVERNYSSGAEIIYAPDKMSIRRNMFEKGNIKKIQGAKK